MAKRALILVLAAAITLAGCGQTSSTPEPTATAMPPTSVPPTATALPTATAEPTVPPAAPEDIVYYEPSGKEPRTLSIHYPDIGEAPYPWVLVMGCLQCQSNWYDPFAAQLLSRGYAVVQLSTSGLGEEAFCAWAWLEANGSDYGLDLDRAIAFSHAAGPVATMLGLADELMWDERLQGCPSPAPSPAHIAGFVTYADWFLIPGGSLTWFDGDQWFGTYGSPETEAPKDTVMNLDAVLKELPPEAWRTSDRLDDEMRAIARQLPLYYANGPKPAEQMPAFLIIDSIGDSNIPTYESQVMADLLTDAGLSVETLWLPDATFDSILSSISDIPEQVADALDAFAQEAFSNE